MNKKILKTNLLLISLIASFSFSVVADMPLPTDVQEPQPRLPRMGASNERILVTGDRVSVKVFPEDEYIKGIEMEVSSEGNIVLPMIGKVKIAGLSLLEAERKLVEIINADYIVDPEVVIEIIDVDKEEEDSLSIAISVLGAVKAPNNYDIEYSEGEPITLIQAILQAGGFSEVANIKKIKIVRKASGKNEVIRVNAESIISGKVKDIPLAEGDIIHVAESLF